MREVIDDHVVTVSTALRRPIPATRAQTLASVFEMSSPAHRACNTSVPIAPFTLVDPTFHVVRRGEDREKGKSDARAQGTNPRFPWTSSTTMLIYRLTDTRG
jgi:hypothetical protein